MAQRRMFSKDIVGTDSFLEMPISSQLLYFQLGMEADDDGFVGSPKKVARIIGAGGDDLKILSAKRFILISPSGIVVVRLVSSLFLVDKKEKIVYKVSKLNSKP